MDCSTPGFPALHYLPEFAQTHVHWVNDGICLILCCPLLLLPPVFPRVRVFFNKSDLCIRWPKYWGFSFSIRPFKECSGLISFRTDWFDLLSVQGTLKSLPQHHNSKALFLWCSTFMMIQHWHSHMTWKTFVFMDLCLYGPLSSK